MPEIEIGGGLDREKDEFKVWIRKVDPFEQFKELVRAIFTKTWDEVIEEKYKEDPQ